MTKEIEFKIFTKNKGFNITANIIVYSLLFSGIGIAYLAKRYLDNSTIESLGQGVGILACLLMIYFKITQASKRKSLNGNLNKKLRFRSREISIDDINIELNEIKKIEFYIGDYFDKWETQAPGDFSPARTNGTSNICELTLINGHKAEANFQLMYENEFLKMRELLLQYYSENKIHFLKLIEYLGIEKYEEIQEFKKTLPPTLAISNAG